MPEGETIKANEDPSQEKDEPDKDKELFFELLSEMRI